MRLAPLLAAIAAAGCVDEPHLDVAVHHPLDVASTTVSVYESAALDCEQIEFGVFTDDELANALVTETTIDASGATTGELRGMSRVDPKTIVARGRDAAGSLVAIGCTSFGEIDGSQTATVDTNVAATASLNLAADSGGTDQLGIAVNASDPSGNAIDARPVSWTVYGPAGSTPYSSTGITTLDGGAWKPTSPTCPDSGRRVHPMPPSVIGGYAIQMRVAWASVLPAPVSRFTDLTDSLDPLVISPPTSAKYCATRIAGSLHRLVCLSAVGGSFTATDYAVSAANGSARLTVMQTQGGIAQAVAVVSIPDGPNGDDRGAYAVTKTGELVALFGAPAASAASGLPGIVDDALVVPPCGAAAGALLVHVASPDQIMVAGARGGSFARWPGAAEQSTLGAAGCVTEIQQGGAPTLKQVVSIENAAITHVSFDCGPASCTNIALATDSAVGFTGGSEPRLITPTVDATGVVMVQLVLGASPVVHFVERARAPSAGMPTRIVVGKFDDDSAADLLWSIDGATRGTTFEVAYGRTINGSPIEALSNGKQFAVDDLFASDYTGDGYDDLVLTGTLSILVGSTTITRRGVVVVPMNAASAPIDLGDPDIPCAP